LAVNTKTKQFNLEEPQVDDAAATARAKKLGQYHQAREGGEKRRREEDCRVVAEAELAEADALLTFDKTLQKNLGSHARLRLLAPLEYWTALAIPHRATPVREPDKSHPLYHADWLRW
jgi:predicted nucleic acid-binding protein